MSINVAQYPDWDGLGPNRTERQQDASPDYEDWDQLIAEYLVMQNRVKNVDGIFTAVNSEGGAMVPGNVIFLHTDGTIKLADADGSGTREVAGVVEVGAADAGTVTVRYAGVLSLTLAEWDAVGTDASGLDPGLLYLMADVLGEITTTPPATATDTLYRLGKALNATDLLINLEFDGLVP